MAEALVPPPGQSAKAAWVPTLRGGSNPTVILTLNLFDTQHQLTATDKPWLVEELPKNRRRTEVAATIKWQHWCHRQAHSQPYNR